MTNRIIAVAAEDNKGMAGHVSHHFGRCPYYVMIEVEDDKLRSATVTANPYYGNHQPGQMPRFIHDQGAKVILAGGMGPQAVQMFQQYGIEVATGAVGRVGRVIGAYLRGEINGTVPCQHNHPDSCGGH